jgi:hypothetical protein
MMELKFLVSAGGPPSSSEYNGLTVARTFSNVTEPSPDLLLVIVHSRDRAWLKRTVKRGVPPPPPFSSSSLSPEFIRQLTSIIATSIKVSVRLVTVADIRTVLNLECRW